MKPSLFGGADEIVRTRERARELFGAGSELGEGAPLPFAMTSQLRALVPTEPVIEVVVEPAWLRHLSGDGICQAPDESDVDFRARVKRLLEIP